MSSTELQSPSPRGLSRLRRNKASNNQSTNSLVSTSSVSDEANDGQGGGLKASLDNVVGKVRKSIDDRRESADAGVSPQRRLSTMFKRKKNRGDDASSRRASQHRGDSELSTQDSRSELSVVSASRSSSLLTDEIPGDDSDLVRPTVSAHSSHRGFLTLSSPAVNAEAEPDTTKTQPEQSSILSTITSAIPSIVEPESETSGVATKEETPLAPQTRSTFPITHRKSVSATPALPSGETSLSKERAASEETSGEAWSATSTAPESLDERPSTPKPRLRVSTAEPETPERPQTPQTFVTPPTPVLDQTSTIGDIRRRRALSSGSKLSKTVTAPLTPTVEETKTPGGTLIQPNNASGFFSTVFSAAQKAADTLTSTISVTSPTKSKAPREDTSTQDIADDSDMRSTTSLVQTQEAGETKTEEEAAAARAVSNAYSKSGDANGRPVSIASNERLTVGSDASPTRHNDDGEALRRTGSVRSRLSGRRHRGSSAATGSAIVSALKESAAGLAHTNSSGQGHRMTGFAVASKKRNKDFHAQFRSVPEDDYLIEDYSAALQRDILLHGRLYVSEGHICFSSNILGWVTNLVMSFDEIVSVEKKSTAVIFPNALIIQTLHAKNTFASFVARDSTYELIIGIWKINHPHLKSSLNGVALDSGTGDRTEKAESVSSDGSDTESDDEFYDEDAEDDPKASYIEGETTRSVAGSDVGESTLDRKASNAPVAGDSQQTGGSTKAKEVNDSAAGNSTVANSDSVGPDTHEPTECGDNDKHYDRPLADTTIPAPLGKIYSLMWGPGSGAFMSKWLVDDQKSRELDLKDDKTGLDNDHKTVTFSYIKPLGGSIGPKQTKCITTNTLEAFDLQKAVVVNCSTQTPDVPSGNVFVTKTHYCLMWGPDNSTRLIANCTIEWSGKSWLKGPIEKGAQDGQTQYVKDIVAALKAAVSSKTAAKGPPKKGKKKGKKDEGEDESTKEETSPTATPENSANWGPLELVRPIFEPVVGLVKPFLSSQVVIAVLFVLLVYTWVLPPHRGHTGLERHAFSSPERVAAYEQLWHQEESALWDWLEDRVGVDDEYAARMANVKQRQKVVAARELGKKLEDKKMSGRQLDEAIRTTEEKLAALKDAVERKKLQGVEVKTEV